jgi:hypothetical protein
MDQIQSSTAPMDAAKDAMVRIDGWARLWGCSEQQCHRLRHHELFPQDCEVVLGPRAVRFRLSRLAAFAAALAASRQRLEEPARLKRARQERVARDQAASWIPDRVGSTT